MVSGSHDSGGSADCPSCLNGCGGARSDCPMKDGASVPPAKQMGRPTKFRREMIVQATKLCEFGATDIELADFFGVDVRTIYRWQASEPDFCQALKAGKAAADERVERALFHKATGYSFDAVKIFQHDGAPVEVPYREQVAPDTTACIFWLKNRRPDLWRDKVQTEGPGKDGEHVVRIVTGIARDGE